MDGNNRLIQTLETAGEADYLLILISLFFCIISSFILMFVYKNKANSLSSKIQISMIIPLLSNITFLVILIVKSSLALSLGLVGALSIVRFRAAIKEPEELVYLFLIIAIGLGCGANQLIITSVGIIFALILIVIYSGYMKNSRKDIEQTINLGVIIEQDISDVQVNNLISDIKKISNELKFISMSRTENNTTINIDLKPNQYFFCNTFVLPIRQKRTLVA